MACNPGPSHCKFCHPFIIFYLQTKPNHPHWPTSNPTLTFHIQSIVSPNPYRFIAIYHLLSIHPIENSSSNLTTSPSSILLQINSLPLETLNILLQFATLFQNPTKLPPQRPHDHHITFLPNTKPINIKLYRYPHC